MDNIQKREISKDLQIKKFCFYGFFKNLVFFKPYLVVYLLGNGLTLIHIGLLVSIREIVVNLFEIPSGLFADTFGRKKVLLISFVFYQIAFIFFFFCDSFFIASIAMFFFGLGKAFRSGSNKAMLYTYLEKKSWQGHKTFVYGKTRSFSLLGTAISSILAIVLILSLPHSRFIFIASIIPFVLDFLLVLSYPNYLNKTGGKTNKSLWGLVKETAKELNQNETIRKLLFTQSFFDGLFKTIEDFIQPILSSIILGAGILIFSNLDSQTNLNIVLGITYAVINLINSIGSRYAYVFKNALGARNILNFSYLLLGGILVILALFIEQYILVIAIFLFLNVSLNIRKPIFVDEIGNEIPKSERATILSIASQLESITITILAPILGFLAEEYSIAMAMMGGAIFVFLTKHLCHLKDPSKQATEN